jgi:hypothetical protein
MSRYVLIAAIEGQPAGYPRSRWPAGTTIADSAGNAQPGDLVWPMTPNPNALAPLDAAAVAAFAAVGVTATVGGPHPWLVGVAGM